MQRIGLFQSLDKIRESHLHVENNLLTILKKFEMPSWLGRLPTRVCYSSGGSLTADEYKVLILAFLPVAVSC